MREKVVEKQKPNAIVPAESKADCLAKLEREFQALFSDSPSTIVAAPGRVNLIGEHIDYNDGYVLPMAVERYTWIAASPAARRGAATFFSLNLGESATISLEPHPPHVTGIWSSYLQGVVAGYVRLGYSVPSFDAIVHSDVPLGGGLSSSAALEIAAATLIESLTARQLPPLQKALLCQQAEHEFAGVPCGVMDQFSSVFGRSNELMMLDCRTQELTRIPFADQDLSVLIIDCGTRHELVDGEYAVRRQQCDSALRKLKRASWRDVTPELLASAWDHLSEVERRRARHVVSESARTRQAADCMRRGQLLEVGELMYESHESLCHDYEVSCRELDTLVDIAREIGHGGGVIGARMTGGGFGGCTVCLVRSSRVEPIANQMAEAYERRTGMQASCFVSRPARGAHVVRNQ